MRAPKMSSTLTQLKISDSESVREALDQLRHHESPLNWLMFGYQDRDTLEMLNVGEGGLEELRDQLGEEDIRFAVVECVVTGDSYNSIKFVLVTWIGGEVPPGLAKARAAGHRKELVTFLTESLAIAAEFQPSSKAEFTSKDVSAALTKRAATYQDTVSTGERKENRQVMSRSHASSGDRSKSQLKITDEQAIVDALLSVHRGENEWAHITYVQGKKDEVYLKGTGSGGLSKLREELPENNVSFCLVTFEVTETTSTVTKYVLLTWVGEYTPPLQKARSGPHRSELADWIISIVPFHSHYQANEPEDLELEKVLFKLRS